MPHGIDLLRDYSRVLRARFGERLAEVRLFGSYARGEAREESDVDILVLVRDLSWREKIAGIELAAEIGLPKGIALAPVVMSVADFDRLLELESSFAETIRREGVVA